MLAIIAAIGVLFGVGLDMAAAQTPDPQPRVRCRAMTNLFAALDMTPVQLRDYLADGGTLKDLAGQRDVDLPAIVEQWQQDLADCTTAAVEAGAIPAVRGEAILAALEDGRLTPFPRDGGRLPNGQGIFLPGDWGVRPEGDGVFGPGDWGVRPEGDGVFLPGGWGNRPDDGGPPFDSPGDDTVRPEGDGVFSPGGWGWVDRPELADISGADADWIGHPYYQGIFSPGGWGYAGGDAPADQADTSGDDASVPPDPAGPGR